MTQTLESPLVSKPAHVAQELVYEFDGYLDAAYLRDPDPRGGAAGFLDALQRRTLDGDRLLRM